MANINLLPWRELQATQIKKRFFRTFYLCGIGAALIILNGYFYFIQQQAQQNKRNQYLLAEIIHSNQRVAKLKLQQKSDDEFMRKVINIKKLQFNRIAAVHLFDEMVTTLPQGLYLTHLKQEGTKIHLAGKATSDQQVSVYMNHLNLSAWFTAAQLEDITNIREKDNNNLPLWEFHLNIKQMLPN